MHGSPAEGEHFTTELQEGKQKNFTTKNGLGNGQMPQIRAGESGASGGLSKVERQECGNKKAARGGPGRSCVLGRC